MSIKEILKNAALLLGRDNVIDYCNGVTVNDDTLRTVNNMTGLINLVLSELACTYIPMVKRETVRTSNVKIYYKDFLCQRPKSPTARHRSYFDPLP